MEYSNEHLLYLSRNYLDTIGPENRKKLSPEEMAVPKSASLSSIHIHGIGRLWEKIEKRTKEHQRPRYKMEDALTGCYGAKLPVFYLVKGTPASVNFYMGSLEPYFNNDGNDNHSSNSSILQKTLPGHYPGIDISGIDNPEQITPSGIIGEPEYCGLITGIPTVKQSEETDDPTQIDRLIRTMYGSDWGILVIAQPLPEEDVNEYLTMTTNEMRRVENAEQMKMRKAPLAETYFKELQLLYKEYILGRAMGLWSTTAYYFSDSKETFLRLGAALRSYYGGNESQPEPLRSIEFQSFSKVLPLLGQPIVKADTGPGKFNYPMRYQTLLNSARLAALVHLPRLEMPGYTVRESVRLDVAPHKISADSSIRLGTITDYGRSMGVEYKLSPSQVNKHALVVGVTGSGKTNTSFYLLKQLWEQGIPFLVIEPAKKEYRSLLNDSTIGKDLRVFTLANELVSPFRINPFECGVGVSLSTHIDLLKSVFNAAFSMWTVLPQILEQSLHEVYRECGWDIVMNKNDRILDSSGRHKDSFPTMADLQHTVRRLVDRLGYESNTASELKAALVTRLQSLRVGGKGKMLDTRDSFDFGKLLEKPTVIELEDIGDDDEKAFLIGLLLVKLYEYIRGDKQKAGKNLKHVVVIEEAHRLLANVRTHAAADVANTRGKAVETFVNMLSEVRAYGVGFVIAEQIPSKLAPDVIKNTNVKAVHRTVAGEDRSLMSQAMNMDEKQKSIFATLTVGESVVFAEGDDKPIIVKVPKYESGAPKKDTGRIDPLQQVAQSISGQFPEVTMDCLAGCKAYSELELQYCDTAQKIAEKPEIKSVTAHYILSIIEQPENITDKLLEVLRRIKRHVPGLIESDVLMKAVLNHSVALYLRTRGQNYLWPYEEIVGLKTLLVPSIIESLKYTGSDNNPGTFNSKKVEKFGNMYRALCRRNFNPFPYCGEICDQRPEPLCLYRFNTASLLRHKRLHRDFVTAIEEAGEALEMIEALESLCRLAASLCVADNINPENHTRIALCFASQKIFSIPQIRPSLQNTLVMQLVNFMKAQPGRKNN